MSRPTFRNPFDNATKTGGMGNRRRSGLMDPSPSGTSDASRTQDTSLRPSLVGNELAMALLLPRDDSHGFLDVGTSRPTQPSVSTWQRVAPSLPDEKCAPPCSDAHSAAEDESKQSSEAKRSRKGSLSALKGAKQILSPAPLLKRFAGFFLQKEPGLSSAEERRLALRELLAQNPLKRPSSPSRYPTPSRPPRPETIDSEVLDRAAEIPFPDHSPCSCRPATVGPQRQGFFSSHSPPRPPPKAKPRVGLSEPMIPLVRQKIGVSPDPHGRVRARKSRDEHWEVLQLNQYRIPRPWQARWLNGGVLGQGGFGTVYLVYDVPRGQQCAMKVVHYSRGMSEVSCQGTINELLVLRKLAEESRRAPFLLQPYVEGSFWAWRSAGEYLHILTDVCTGGELSYYRNQIPEHRLALVCAEVMLGMNHLHRLGIVHHDIKPQNVLVNGDGHCVLSDYGGAQFLDGRSHIRRPRRMQAVMTKPFAAPELLGVDDAVTAACTKAVDYWALGATIVWLTMEDKFLPGTSDPHTLTMRLGRIRDEMDKADASVELQHFVMALLRPDPDERPGYAAAKRLPFLEPIDWFAVQNLQCPPFKDNVKPVGVLAHGFMLGPARVHNAREPVNLLERMRQAQLSLVADESFDVEAHNAAMAVSLDG